VIARPWSLPRSTTPAGGITAGVCELLRFARLQLGDGTGPNGEPVLSPESLHAMRQPLVPSTGLPDRAVGLAWNIGRSNINHSGGTWASARF
jgi:hypothetical protein